MLKTLLRVRMAALLAAFTGQSRKRKNQTKGKAAGYAFLMLYCFCAFVFLFYTSFSQFAAAFFPAGLGWLYFAMFAIMAFALMFIGSVFTAKSQLFEAKDNELLLSMPVPPGMILLSRMAALLAMNFVFELVVALPVFVSWLQYGGASGSGILAFVVIVLVLPLFSLAVSCLFAWLVSLITSRMRNTFIAPGKDDDDEMIRTMGDGLYAAQMGGGSVNPATGEFNFAVQEGYLVRDGKIVSPVRGASLIGKGNQILMRIDRVGKHMTMGQGMCGSLSGSVPTNVGQPTIRVSSLTVGGK